MLSPDWMRGAPLLHSRHFVVINQAPRKRPGVLVAQLLLLACALYALRIDIVYLFQRLPVPYSFDYEEGNVLNAGMRMAHGLTPYPDPHVFPNVLDPYGPVAYGLVAIAVRLGGVTFLWPRLIVALAGLAVGALIGLIVRRETKSLVLALAFGALYLSLPVVQMWLPILRIDPIGLALTLAGLYCCLAWAQRAEFAALLFAAALFVKFSFVAAPVAAVLWLVLQHRARTAVRLAATLLVLVLAGFLVMQATTSGHFAFHSFDTHPDPLNWASFSANVGDGLRHHALLLPLAAFAIGVSAVRRTANLPVIYVLCAFATTLLTAAKRGSSSNHLLELLAALSICSAIGLAELGWLSRPHMAAAFSALAAVVLGLFVLRAGPAVDPITTVPGCAAAYEFAARHPGEILTENTGAALMAGKPLFISNPFVYAYLVRYRGFSETPLVDAIRTRRFGVILLSADLQTYRTYGADRWTPAVVDAIAANYREVRGFACQNANVGLERIQN